jgi:hypothetical protein
MTDTPTPLLAPGEKLLLMPRRRFEKAHVRVFACAVLAVAGDLIRAHGWVYSYRAVPEGYVRKDGAFTFFARLDNDILAVVLPPDCVIEHLVLDLRGNLLKIHDGAAFEWVDTQHVPG